MDNFGYLFLLTNCKSAGFQHRTFGKLLPNFASLRLHLLPWVDVTSDGSGLGRAAGAGQSWGRMSTPVRASTSDRRFAAETRLVYIVNMYLHYLRLVLK